MEGAVTAVVVGDQEYSHWTSEEWERQWPFLSTSTEKTTD